jgi:AraC family transcriptional regulator
VRILKIAIASEGINMLNAPTRTSTPADGMVNEKYIALIETETQWRHSERLLANPGKRAVIVSRWQDVMEGEHCLAAEALDEHYTIEILLAESRVDCFKNGNQISALAGGFGATQIAGPGEKIKCRFTRKMRAIHLFVPARTVVEAYEEVEQRSCPRDFQLADPAFRVDHRLAGLASVVIDIDAEIGPFMVMYLDALTTAILARLLDAHTTCAGLGLGSTGLQPWLLRRVIHFMEENLHTPVTLQDIAAQTGLSRMHFAAQFRRSTGCSPHAFLLKRRLEKAKEMLAADSMPLREIAFAVGFQSQAHFTTIFRKLVGSTPGRWRTHRSLSQSD